MSITLSKAKQLNYKRMAQVNSLSHSLMPRINFDKPKEREDGTGIIAIA